MVDNKLRKLSNVSNTIEPLYSKDTNTTGRCMTLNDVEAGQIELVCRVGITGRRHIDSEPAYLYVYSSGMYWYLNDSAV